MRNTQLYIQMLKKPKTFQFGWKLIFKDRQKIVEFFTVNLTFVTGSWRNFYY